MPLLAGDLVLESRSRPASPLEFMIPAERGALGASVEVRAYDQVGNIGSAIVPLP